MKRRLVIATVFTLILVSLQASAQSVTFYGGYLNPGKLPWIARKSVNSGTCAIDRIHRKTITPERTALLIQYKFILLPVNISSKL